MSPIASAQPPIPGGTMVKFGAGLRPVDPARGSGLLCSACGFLLIRPQQTECGHRYCTACVQRLLGDTDKVTCCVCSKRLSPDQFHKDRAAEKDALGTAVTCPRASCSWTGTLASYLEHLCPPATSPGPEEKSAPKDLEVHMMTGVPRGGRYSQMDAPSLDLQRRIEQLEVMVTSLRRELRSQASAMQAGQRRCLQDQPTPGISAEPTGCSHGARGAAATSSELASADGTLVWKLQGFSRLLGDAKAGRRTSIYSSVFATHPFGYRLCLRLYPDGDGAGQGTHLSLFMALAKGPYDDLLPWPFLRKVTFYLLDPWRKRPALREAFAPDPLSTSFQQPQGQLNVASGSPLFAPHGQLQNYLKDDTLYIKVVVDTSGMGV
ncbi:TNF receptor-associated factor 3-like isoform X2 [Dermochelys coriacea]|uniref:TNF receptor-associated factor 3-like isoform X2 n=1 Tax=Dermochelys coriacea TaxID=27794 RepID=UPI0018E8F791|nr:TNF receptor-associated factor 3-like isoform X2 [Dermochelys coriacea]